MRLFSALLPPAEVLDDLAGAVDRVEATDPGLRWTSRQQWHVTLGFFGEDDPDARSEWLVARVTGLPAPRLRFAGAGTFPGVLWVALTEPAAGLLRPLAEAAGADDERDDRPFRPHLTLARFRRGVDRDVVRGVRRDLDGYLGPCWRPAEVALMRSEQAHGRHHYTVLTRVPLDVTA